MTAGDMVRLVQTRREIIASMDEATAPFDAVAMPTCPFVPPRIDSLSDDADYARVNALALRNPALGNFLDRCAISLPAHRSGEAPVGFMLMGETGGDARLFAIAAAIEPILKE
jgi:aspartyl-tRNA(Asn)/glutamyl-tRNA(Gln) amidotransferase subunit A